MSKPTTSEIREPSEATCIAAQIWCRPECGNIEMDVVLATAFAEVLQGYIDRLEEQTAFIDAYLGQPDQTRVWDTIRGWEQRIKELGEALKLIYSWADNWDSPFMLDDEWIDTDAPKIKALIGDKQP